MMIDQVGVMKNHRMRTGWGALGLMVVLASCTAKPPASVVQTEPPPPKPAPTVIVLNELDRAALQGALRQLPDKAISDVVGWANPDSGLRGAVKVLRDGFDGENRPCREFHSLVALDQLLQHATGFLCRQPDGTWEMASLSEYPQQRAETPVEGKK